MTTTSKEAEVLDPELRTLTLSDGTPIRIERLKTRQLMRFLKILSRGAGEALSFIGREDQDEDEITSAILSSILFAIPEAEDETIDFLMSMVNHADINEGPRLTKAQREENEAYIEIVARALWNPELDDTVSIITAIVEVEGPHVRELGKRLGVLLKAQQKATQASKKAARKPRASSKSISENSTDKA